LVTVAAGPASNLSIIRCLRGSFDARAIVLFCTSIGAGLLVSSAVGSGAVRRSVLTTTSATGFGL